MAARYWQITLAIVALAVGVGTAAQSAELNPAAVKVTLPDQFKWRDPTDQALANNTLLYGDPEKPGFYFAMNKFKPNRWGVPHYHPNDRFITVIGGTWWKGSGKV